jgi:hypothetical protein
MPAVMVVTGVAASSATAPPSVRADSARAPDRAGARPEASLASPNQAPPAPAKPKPAPPVRTVAVSRIPAGDEIVAGRGDGQGWHLYAAAAAGGWTWHPLATLRPAVGADGERWTGRQCLTGDGRYVVTVVAPWSANNSPAGMNGAGLAYVADAHTGAVRPLVGGVSLHYFTPSCGPGSSVALTRYSGPDEQDTVLVRADAATAGVRQVLAVRGQVTGAVPAADGGFLAVRGRDVVHLDAAGETVRARTGGQPFDLVANGVGGTDFLVGTNGHEASVWQLDRAGARQVGTGNFADLALFNGRDGHAVAAGTTRLDTSSGMRVLPADGRVQAASLDGGAVALEPVGDGRSAAGSGASGVVPRTPLVLQTIVGRTSSASVPAVPAVGRVTRWTPDTAGPAVGVLPTWMADDGSRGAGPVPAGAATGGTAQRSATAASAFVSTCAVARNHVDLQVMQPSPAMVDWAANLAARSLLSGAHARPAGFANLGLPGYSPSADFPLPSLAGSGGNIPREVLDAIFAQESNFKQASPHSIEGLAGNPYVADYYGAAGGYQVGVQTPDCGYGLGQVTSGMTAGAMDYDRQRKVAVDYAEDAAAAAQILAQKWNDLINAGITPNDSRTDVLENWYLATWAYNSGLHASTGSGPWGLGWLNNPANPVYPYNRHPFLHQDLTPGTWQVTYDDAAHPADWPYQEKVFGWMEVPIIDSLSGLYSYSGTLMYSHDGINDQQFLPFELARPGRETFCDTVKNQCDPAAAQGTEPCTRADLECWWHFPASWCNLLINPCHTGSWTVDAGASEPTPTGATQWFPPACNVNTTDVPAGSIIVDSQPHGLNLEGCRPATANWTNNGTFVPTFGDPSNPSAQATDMDLHQLGTALGGHMWFTHTNEPTDASGNSYWGFTGTWIPNLDDGRYEIKVFVPATGASATQSRYTVNDGAGVTYPVTINQNAYANAWVSLGTFWLASGAAVSLTNLGTSVSGDLAFSGVAFVPRASSPPDPGVVRAFAVNSSTIHLNWVDLSGGTAKYEISNGKTSRFSAVGASTFDWTGLPAATSVCFQVRAVNSAGNSQWQPNPNNPLCRLTAPAGSVAPPSATGVSAAPRTSYMIHLTWTDNSGGSAYEISDGTVSLFTSGVATSFDWGGLVSGTHMCFTIRAMKFTGVSSWAPSGSSPVCATTPARSCQATDDVPDAGGFIDFFHGTSLANAQKIRDHGIDLSKGSRYVDFGKGFYVTTDLNQARTWAKTIFKDETPYIVHFRVAVTDLEPGGMCGVVFPGYGGANFQAFVLAMRTFEPPVGGAGYDFVEGPYLANPFDFISGAAAPQVVGQQDSFHTARGATILTAGYKELFPA